MNKIESIEIAENNDGAIVIGSSNLPDIIEFIISNNKIYKKPNRTISEWNLYSRYGITYMEHREGEYLGLTLKSYADYERLYITYTLNEKTEKINIIQFINMLKLILGYTNKLTYEVKINIFENIGNFYLTARYSDYEDYKLEGVSMSINLNKGNQHE